MSTLIPFRPLIEPLPAEARVARVRRHCMGLISAYSRFPDDADDLEISLLRQSLYSLERFLRAARRASAGNYSAKILLGGEKINVDFAKPPGALYNERVRITDEVVYPTLAAIFGHSKVSECEALRDDLQISWYCSGPALLSSGYSRSSRKQSSDTFVRNDLGEIIFAPPLQTITR